MNGLSSGERTMRIERLAALILIVGGFAGGARAAERLPNVVILYADDFGYGDLGCQNPAAKIPTPHLDRLAREGMRFTDAHSSSGVCTPSRYALLHGRAHWRKFHGIVNAFDQPILDPERLTLAELLRGKGYATAAIGKWHLGWDWDAIRRAGTTPRVEKGNRVFAPGDFDWSRPIPGGPLDHGFDVYFGDDVPNFPPYAWFENDRLPVAPSVDLHISAETAEGNWECRAGPAVPDWDFRAVMPRLTARAVDWIEGQSAARAFFLYFPFTSPHAPIVPTAEFTGRSAAGGYGDYVVQTDAAVGAVLDALGRKGLLDDTLVIFSSDNGPERYAYERIRRHGHRSMGPLRGLKRDLWEGGHRVPLLVRWPGRVPAGRVEDGLVSQMDLFATLAAVVGAGIPAGSAEDSIDQSACLLGTGPSRRTMLIHNTSPGRYALREGDWVLIDAPTGGVSQVPEWYALERGDAPNDQPGELYNLRDDLAQRSNRYAAEPRRVDALRQQLRTIVGDRLTAPAK